MQYICAYAPVIKMRRSRVKAFITNELLLMSDISPCTTNELLLISDISPCTTLSTTVKLRPTGKLYASECIITSCLSHFSRCSSTWQSFSRPRMIMVSFSVRIFSKTESNHMTSLFETVTTLQQVLPSYKTENRFPQYSLLITCLCFKQRIHFFLYVDTQHVHPFKG